MFISLLLSMVSLAHSSDATCDRSLLYDRASHGSMYVINLSCVDTSLSGDISNNGQEFRISVTSDGSIQVTSTAFYAGGRYRDSLMILQEGIYVQSSILIDRWTPVMEALIDGRTFSIDEIGSDPSISVRKCVSPYGLSAEEIGMLNCALSMI